MLILRYSIILSWRKVLKLKREAYESWWLLFDLLIVATATNRSWFDSLAAPSGSIWCTSNTPLIMSVHSKEFNSYIIQKRLCFQEKRAHFMAILRRQFCSLLESMWFFIRPLYWFPSPLFLTPILWVVHFILVILESNIRAVSIEMFYLVFEFSPILILEGKLHFLIWWISRLLLMRALKIAVFVSQSNRCVGDAEISSQRPSQQPSLV